ncbi:MAG: hypothetical protein AMXMBFR33_24430 [Candidatus Xenobia bacterium]
MGAVIWGCAAAVAALQLSLPGPALSAFLGGFLGLFLAARLDRTLLRTSWGAALIALATVALQLLARLPGWIPPLGRLTGAANLLLLTEILSWFCLSLTTVAFWHFLSRRIRFFSGLELAIVVGILASPFAAHRGGFINRPYFLVDPLWSRGYDPVPVLFALGALAATAGALVTLGRSSRRGHMLDALLIPLLLLLIFALLPSRALRDWFPDKAESMGLTGKPREGGKGKGNERPQNEMELEDNHEQSHSPTPVAVVLLQDDYTPPSGAYYFRQTAFSVYNGRRLVADLVGQGDKDIPIGFPAPGLDTSLPSRPASQVPTRKLKTTVALISSHTRPIGLITPERFVSQNNPNPEQFWKAYEVESEVMLGDEMMLLGRPAGETDWTPEVWKQYTEVPPDPRYKKLADEVCERLRPELRRDPYAQALAVRFFLEKEGIYSLRSRHMHAADPVADFLFGDKTGYCVHFAHAAVYLMRSQGVPARVGAGYYSDARNRGRGSSILIRSGEAHAWPEIYLQGVGWVVVDISPERSLVPEMSGPDPELQRMLGQMARNEKDELRGERKNLREMLLRFLLISLKVLLLAALVTMLGLGVWKVWRRLAFHYGPESRALGRAYRAALDALSDVGIRRQYGQGRLDFAREQQERFPELLELTRMHLDRVMGPPGTPPASRSEAVRRYRELTRSIRSQVKPARRLLGALNPFSWLLVK